MTEEELNLLLRDLLIKFLHWNFDQLLAYFGSLSGRERSKLNDIIKTADFFAPISDQKNRLADIVLNDSGTKFLPEDRLRTVFLLAKMYQSNFKSAESSFKSEFGANFNLQSTFQVHGHKYSWQELAVKAKNIKNAYGNLDMFIANDLVTETMVYLKSFKETNLDKLADIISICTYLLAALEHRQNEPGEDVELIAIRKKLTDLFKLCQMLPLDIQKLDEKRDFEEYPTLIEHIRFAAMSRAFLINNKIPMDELEPARRELLKYLSGEVAFLYRGDSMLRKGIKLDPL